MAGAVENSAGVVTGTVWFTLLVGIIFIVLGYRGKQRWLQFWGWLTCLLCGVYFFRDVIGLAAWFGA